MHDSASRSPEGLTPLPTQEEIAQRAREIWLARGQPDGCDMEIWLQAERELLLPPPAAPKHTAAPAAPERIKPNESPADTAFEAGTTGVRRTKRAGRSLQEKVDDSTRPGGYGQGGHMHVGPSA
jgi:hypothetical protein